MTGCLPLREKKLETREDWADYVADKLARRMKGDEQRGTTFILLSDLKEVWTPALFRDLIGEYLTDADIKTMRESMLPFLSFVVWIRNEKWFEHLPDLMASGTHASLTLPMTKERLSELGLPQRVWDSQFLFIPVTVRFDDFNDEIQKVENPLMRLPFVTRNPATTSGAFGKVEFCKLSNECVLINDHDVGSTIPREPVAVAVKTFEIRKEAVKEVGNLRLLKSCLAQNRNLALHRCVLEHGTEFKIMFAQAKLGDLWQFLHCGHPPEDFERDQHRYRFEDRFPSATPGGGDLMPTLAEQAQNLASALKFLHEPRPINGVMTFCAHMDLKPDNILIYDGSHDGKPLPVGHWKICDFGISSFKESKDKIAGQAGEGSPAAWTIYDLYTINTLQTDAKRNEGTYQPPEVAKLPARAGAGERRKVGRKADIWSFGAIFAEILAFAMGRDAYVKQFRQERISGSPKSGKKGPNDFFYSKIEVASPTLSAEPAKKEPRLRQSVIDWLERLSANCAAPQRSIQCWKEVVLKILQVNPSDRPDAAELERWVGHVYAHVNNAKEYNTPTCPWVEKIGQKRKKGQPALPLPPPPPAAGNQNRTAQAKPTGIEQLVKGVAGVPNVIVQRPTGFGAEDHGPSSRRVTHPLGSIKSETQATTRATTDPSEVAPWFGAGHGKSTPTSLATDIPEGPAAKASFSTSVSPGKPKHAYGIRCNRDAERRLLTPSQTHNLWPGPRRPRAISTSVDASRNGSLKVAYLTSDGAAVVEFDSERRPSFLPFLTLDGEGSTKWKGVGLGGNYLAVWGTSEKGRRAALKVARLKSNGKEWHLFSIPLNDFKLFDVDKRVTVSRQGFVALMCYEKLVIINLNDPMGIFPRETPRNPQPFVDAAFNDTGDLLFAWATPSSKEPSAGLFVYRVDDLEGGRMESMSYYKCGFNASSTTRLIPYNSYNGCVVVEDDQYYYPAVISAGPTSCSAQQSKNYSETIRKSTLKTSSMYNNHSLLAVQKGGFARLHDRLVEYPLSFEGTYHHFGEPVELCKLETRVESTSQIKAVRIGGDVCIFIFNLDWKYEIVQFQGRTFRDAGGQERHRESMRDTNSEFTDSSKNSRSSVGAYEFHTIDEEDMERVEFCKKED